ncbi:MAG TPA: TetR family transcriptional regulator [Myxococcota bacterium]|nr:TetR family transcriptional regulator [Myxococcota bacterium]
MTKPIARTPGVELDGRLARSERSREAIVAAMLALVGEGEASPTAERVAERAQVGIRTVFRHFRDMESLFREMDARLQAEVAPRFAGAAPPSGLEPRVRGLVERRCRLYETIAPYQRARAVRRGDSAILRASHAALTRRLRVDLRRWLPELERAPEPLAEALELVTSFEAWDRLRSDQRLGAARAHAALERAALALAAELRR